MTVRKLATIRRIKAIKPIEGADFIELALIDGWQCVAKKGEFEPGNGMTGTVTSEEQQRS